MAIDRLRDLLQWLEELRQNLEDTEVTETAHISRDPDSERSPKDRSCEVCLRIKMTRARCRRRIGEAVLRAEKVGDLMTADHRVFREEGESRNNHRYAVVVQDPATQWIQSCPCGRKLLRKQKRGYTSFWSRRANTESFTLTIRIWQSLRRSVMESSDFDTSSICDEWYCSESGSQRIKEGTTAVLVQSGLDEKSWAGSMECCCSLRNVQVLLPVQGDSEKQIKHQ